jgi:septal ring factor EnvC (AmiA/AmiB activator)
MTFSRHYLCVLLISVAAFSMHAQECYAEKQEVKSEKLSLDDHKESLKKTANELGSSQEKHKNLEQTLNKTQQELTTITAETQKIAALIQEGEAKLTELEAQLSILLVEKTDKEIALRKRGKELSGMVGAMIRLGRAPSEAVLVMPQGIAGKIQASRALGMMSESMRTQIEEMSKQVAELQALEQKLTANQQATKLQNEKLVAKREKLDTAIKQRQELIQALQGDAIKEQKRIAELSKKSKSLELLIGKLEEEREKQRQKQLAKEQEEARRAASQTTPTPQKTKQTETKPIERNITRPHEDDVSLSQGSMKLPVAGRISGRYGQKRNANDTLKGIQISTREGAQVTAPAAGQVLFTGPFMEYGKVVIIRHNNRYHTLLAGLGSIRCATGQRIDAGEPIGTMGSSDKGKQLYVELRSNGTPVDPIPWLQSSGGLAKK